MPRILWVVIVGVLLLPRAEAQTANEVNFGVGASLLGTGDVTIISVEGEAMHHWNRLVSGAAALGLGYGNTYWYDQSGFSTLFSRDATAHLDATFLLSPFGNNSTYRLSLGTGPSLMYVRDQDFRRYGDIAEYESPEHRVSLGASVVLEQSIRLRSQYRLGVKAMFQPYLNGDGALTLLVRIGHGR